MDDGTLFQCSDLEPNNQDHGLLQVHISKQAENKAEDKHMRTGRISEGRGE